VHGDKHFAQHSQGIVELTHKLRQGQLQSFVKGKGFCFASFQVNEINSEVRDVFSKESLEDDPGVDQYELFSEV